MAFSLVQSLFALLVIVVLPFLHRFFKSGPQDRPKRVNYLIPWIGNAIQYGRGPHSFLERCRKQHGDVFTVHIAGQDLTFFTTAPLMSALFRNSKDFIFKPFREEVLASVFGTSPFGTFHAAVDQEVYPVASRHFSKAYMGPCMSEFGRTLLPRLQALRASTKGKAQSTSLWATVFGSMYVSHSHAAFGPSFPTESTFDDYARFDDGFSILAASRRVPTLITKPYRAVRQRMVSTLRTYLRERWSDPGNAVTGASEVISEVTSIMKSAGFSEDDISGHLLSFLWGTQANTTWTIFWFLASLACDQEATQRLREEVDAFVRRYAGDLSKVISAPASALEELPLLESGMKETLRLFSAFLVARLCTHDTVLYPAGRGPLRIVEGEVIFSTPRNIHMDPEVYHEPETFKLDRYLEEDGKTFRTVGDDGKTLQGSYVPWGGGEHKCKGKAIAIYETKLFMILFMHMFEFPQCGVQKRGGDGRGNLNGVDFPRPSRTSIGLFHTYDDFALHLSPRGCAPARSV